MKKQQVRNILSDETKISMCDSDGIKYAGKEISNDLHLHFFAFAVKHTVMIYEILELNEIKS